MSLVNRLLMPRGPALPPGVYDADIGTVFTPSGPGGPAHFKARVFDEHGEPLGKHVFHATDSSVFRVGTEVVGQSEALERLDGSDHVVAVTVEIAGQLREMDLSGLRPSSPARLTSASS